MTKVIAASIFALSMALSQGSATAAEYCTSHTTPPLMTGLNSPKGLIYCAPIAPTGALSGRWKATIQLTQAEAAFRIQKDPLTATHGEIRLRGVTQPDAAQAALLERLARVLPKRMRRSELELPAAALSA